MPLDRPILVAGTAAVPASYEVSNAEEIMLLAVHAVYDGTGASGVYVPAIEIVSDGGITIALVPSQAEVAAGSSASVTFAPTLAGETVLTASSSSVAIATSAAGSTTLVAGVASRSIQVMQVGVMAAGTVGVKFTGGGDLTGVYPLAANTGFVLGPSPEGRPWFKTASGSPLGITLDAGVAVGGVVVVEVV